MYRLVKNIFSFPRSIPLSMVNRNFTNSINIEVKEEVRFALENRKPLVALESTIITHGMPFPENIKCALDVEGIVRKQGAIPATVAVINGVIKVGLSEDELNVLGDIRISKPIKTSRRDLPYVVSNKLNGGTTVCGTLIVAHKTGIPIFATGGIGGVHRGAQETFDISADLLELGKCGVAVISSGVKSILDIPKTLEYLETQGVFVATFGDTDEFPAFYSRVSGSKAPYCVETAMKAANIIKCNRDLDMRSGMLFAVPVPVEYALDPETMNHVIEEALREAKGERNMGKNVTPFLLSQVAKITGGKSLQSNIALIKNNAKTAADIAVALAKLELPEQNISRQSKGVDCNNLGDLQGRPVVIGGSNLDCSITLKTSEIKLDGRIYNGHFSYTAGGVARNICESLCKLGCSPNFISAIGDDEPGRLLKSFIPPESSHMVNTLKTNSTAQCIIVFDKEGDCKFLMGHMEIHKEITPEIIRSNENIIQTSPLIILDANLSVECIGESLKLALKHNIPVFFETTDVEISAKPFETPYWKAVKFITPNINELRHIASFLDIAVTNNFCNNVAEAAAIAKRLVNYIENVIVTLGADGVLIARRGLATDPFLLHKEENKEVYIRHYPVNKIDHIVNVSGAGDCLASGILAGILSGLSEEHCMSVGFAAAQSSLYSQSAIPKKIFDRTHSAWNTCALYKTIL